MTEFHCRYINQEKNHDPQRNRAEAMPRKGRDQIGDEIARWIVLDNGEMDKLLEQAGKKHDNPIKRRLEKDRS